MLSGVTHADYHAVFDGDACEMYGSGIFPYIGFYDSFVWKYDREGKLFGLYTSFIAGRPFLSYTSVVILKHVEDDAAFHKMKHLLA